MKKQTLVSLCIHSERFTSELQQNIFSENFNHPYVRKTSALITNDMRHTETTTFITHRTFFWGKNGEIFFSGWPGTLTGMYILALIFIFGVSVLVEWLAHRRHLIMIIKPSGSGNKINVTDGLVQMLVHAHVHDYARGDVLQRRRLSRGSRGPCRGVFGFWK